MGCGSSLNQVNDANYPMHSSKPLRIEDVFDGNEIIGDIDKIYLFGDTQTKRKVLEISICPTLMKQQSATITIKSVSQRHHIPRPKISRDTIQMMYQQAQQVFPSTLHNSTTLPPFNLMFITMLNNSVFFLCGGVDYQFWNVNAEAFLYKINNNISNANLNTHFTSEKKIKSDKPQSIMLPTQRTINANTKKYNKFERLAFMNQARYSHMGINLKYNEKNFVYVFGGFNSNKQTVKTCQKYIFEKNIWQKLPQLSTPRATGFCFEYLQKVYIFGGFSKDKKRSKKIQVLELASQKWTTLNIKLHLGIEQGFLTSFNPNQIVVMGGNVQGGSLHSVIRVNIIEETYQWDSNLLYADSLEKGTTLNKNVYLIGGQKPRICQIYDSRQRIWTETKIVTDEEIKIGQLNLFSYLTKSVRVEFSPSNSRKKHKQFASQDLVIFGTDICPLIINYLDNNSFLMTKSVSMKLRLRKNMSIIRLTQHQYLLFGGIDTFEINPTKACFKYNTLNNFVQQYPKLPYKVYNAGTYKIENTVYCIGGCAKTQTHQQIQLNFCCAFNLQKKIWQQLPQLNFKRSQCQIIQLTNKNKSSKILLVFGGYWDGQWVGKLQWLEIQNGKEDTKNLKKEWKLLGATLPLLFPVYSMGYYNEKSNQYVLYILNRNIHMNNFQEIYYSLDLSETLNKKPQNIKSVFPKFDSIDVIINEKQAEIKAYYGSIHTGQKNHSQPNQDANKSDNLEFADNSEYKMYKGGIDEDDGGKRIKMQQNVGMQDVKMPAVQVIQIRSKHIEQFDEIKQEKFQRQVKQTVQENQKDGSISANGSDQMKNSQNGSQNLQDFNAEFQNINLNIQSKEKRLFTQPFQKQILRTQGIQQWGSKQAKKQLAQHYQTQSLSKHVAKGLQLINNPAEWLRIRQEQQKRLIFINNNNIVEGRFIKQMDGQLGITVNTKKLDGQALNVKGLKLARFKQIYA